MTPNRLTIGHVARAAGVNVETIRYYQRVGLIREPVKPLEGFRVYPAETVERIRFIKHAQKLGFSLQDITHLLELGDGHCDDVRQQAEAKLAQIESQIKDLQAMRKTLKKLVAECRAGTHSGHCPIVQSLADKQ
ncbi:MAG: MerR family DNA-binding protein [Gammaproteobacteria bacterium]